MNRSIGIILLLALCAAGLHLAFVATMAESGWSTLVSQWQYELLEGIGFGHVSVDSLEPPDQADFWIAEIDRLEPFVSSSASMQIGAAWVLDSAGIGFLSNHWKDSGYSTSIPAIAIEWDEDAIKTAKVKFRQRCLDRCLLLARQATKTEPDNVHWWRMRALLLFEGDPLWNDKNFEPRCDEWLETLDECARHDPNNALYDYMAALQMWQQAAVYEWPENPTLQDHPVSLTIKNAELFATGTKRFLAGQSKPFLAIGEVGYSAIANFLALTQLPKIEQAEVAVSRLVTVRHSIPFHLLWRWQNARVDNAAQQNDLRGKKERLIQSLKLYDQAISPVETSALTVLLSSAFLRQHKFEQLERLFQDHPEVTDPAEIELLREREKKLRIESATLQQALQKLNAVRAQATKSRLITLVFAEATFLSTVYLFFLAFCCLAVTRVWNCPSTKVAAFGYLRTALSWLLGYSVTFIVLGVFPANMVEIGTQILISKVFIYGLTACLLGIVLLALGKYFSRKKFRVRLSTLFAITTAVALLAYLWPIIALAYTTLIVTPADLLPVEKGWVGLNPELTRAALQVEDNDYLWAFWQWHIHAGVLFSLALFLLIMLAWQMRLRNRNTGKNFSSYWSQQLKSRWLPLLNSLGRSTALIGACWLLAYFCIAPSVIRIADADFHHKIDYCRNPTSHYAKIREVQADIKSSSETMKLIKEEVDFELSDREILERDFSN